MQKPFGASEPKRRALFLSPEAPFPLRSGGAIRSASLLTYLSQHFDIHLILFRQPHEENPSQYVPEGLVARTLVLELPFHSRKPLARAARNVTRAVKDRPPLLDRFSGFETQIEDFVSKTRYALGVLEHFWCAPYEAILRGCCDRLVLDPHNIESVLHQRLAAIEKGIRPLLHSRFAGAYRRLEKELLPRFSDVLVTSKADAAHLAPLRNAVVYPNTIPFTARRERKEKNAIVFSGNLAYEPNTAAVYWFHDQVWPLLHRMNPQLIWRIVGKNPEAAARLAGKPNIELTGPVEDAINEIATAKVAVVPVHAGSGTRIKILEAWAAGTPVISTTIGAEGLECTRGEHLLVVDDPEEFAEAVAFLVEAEEARVQLAEAGRCLYERRYTWPAGWESLNLHTA